MSLLDAARRLAETDPAELVNSHSRCHWCEEFTSTEQHTPDCPWLAMPQIVAALEAAERVILVSRHPAPRVNEMIRAEDALGDALGIGTTTEYWDREVRV